MSAIDHSGLVTGSTPAAPRAFVATQRHVGVLVCCLLLWASCGGVQPAEPLSDAVRAYNDALRWQRFDSAAARVTATDRDAFLDVRDQLHEDLRINNYEVIRVRFDGEESRARVHVKVTWHLDSQGIVHDTHTVQTWHREGSHWFLIRENHLRGEPMPGVEEGSAEPAEPQEVENLPPSQE